MQRSKRPFYIIAHNANTIEEAEAFLDKGANALEPDIVHANGKFYVSHQPHRSYNGVPVLEDFLHDLKLLMQHKKYNLALIIWDMKDTDFDPNKFMTIVKQHFSGEICDGVAMLMTHADDHGFLGRYRGEYPNVGIGVDESNTPPSQLESFFTLQGQKNFTYADGITTFLAKPGVYANIMEAQHCRYQNEPKSFGLVYTWVLHQKDSMRKYLDGYIDGIFVDVDSVKKLRGLIASPPYNDTYRLAENGYNPFETEAIPKYRLVVTTMDKFAAGTDARFIFTLAGQSGGLLKSLPYHASPAGALERGSSSCIILEGMNLGEIKSLTVEALDAGPGSGWLPQAIQVDSRLLKQPVHFIFSDNHHEAWISRNDGPVTRFPFIE